MSEIQRIYILGHPAAGKAFFSKSLAEAIGYSFIDADTGLEHLIGLPFDKILGASGLKHYELTQEKILETLSQKSGIVVGLDCHIGDTKKVREHLRNGLVIFLKTSTDTQCRRSGNRKPLIVGLDYEDLFNTLHSNRDDYYAELSDLILHSDEGNIDKEVKSIINYINEKGHNFIEDVGLSDNDLIFFKHNTDIAVRISEQQAICLRYLSKGKTAKEIAREMNISYRTVEVYIAQLKEKLECDSSKELINIYLFKP